MSVSKDLVCIKKEIPAHFTMRRDFNSSTPLMVNEIA